MIDNVEQRILAAKERAAGRSGDFGISRQEGTEPLAKPATAGQHQTDASVPRMETTQEAPVSKVGKPGGTIGDAFTMPTSEGSEAVKIGTVTLRKSSLAGWERRFTKDSGDYQAVLEDGTVINNIQDIIKVVHASAWSVKVSKQGAK